MPTFGSGTSSIHKPLSALLLTSAFIGDAFSGQNLYNYNFQFFRAWIASRLHSIVAWQDCVKTPVCHKFNLELLPRVQHLSTLPAHMNCKVKISTMSADTKIFSSRLSVACFQELIDVWNV